MTYLIQENSEDIILEFSAKKIKQEMDNLYKGDKSLVSKRWIWELVQNASDCGNSKIQMIFKENYFEFRHNGKIFDSKTLWTLITQISRKGILEDDDSIGKYGTGFITTHLLSKKINISGGFLDRESNVIPLNFELDRSGVLFEEILENLKSNLKNAEEGLEINNYEKIDRKKDIDTIFTYNVTDDKKNFLEDGKNEIIKNYSLLLTFNTNLKYLKLDEITVYKNENVKIDEHISSIKITMEINGREKTSELLVAKYEEVEIAIFIKENEVEEIKKDIPKIFCQFPLIGSEEVEFPFIINSKNFEVPIERNTILPNSDKNKEIIKIAISLYIKLIKYLEVNKYGKIYNACANFEKNKFVLEDDVKRINDIYKYAKIIEIFNNEKELKSHYRKDESSPEMIIIDFIDDEHWKLTTQIKKIKPIPSKDGWKKWSKVHEKIWSIKDVLNYAVFNDEVEKRKEKLENFEGFLNCFYKLEFGEGNVRIYASDEKIILNQNNQFINYNDAYIDDDIKEDLKTLGVDFGVKIKEKLVNKNISIENLKALNLKKISNKKLADEITSKVKSLLKEEPRKKETQEAFNKLVLWLLNNEKLSKNIFEEIFEDKYKLATKEEIIESFNRGEKVKKLMDEKNISFDELEKCIIDGNIEENSLNIFKYEKYSTKDRFDSIMERAKEKVIKYLKDLGNYDFSEMEENMGGAAIYNNVKKNNNDIITIMIRPSDGNKMIIYGNEELDVLKDDNYELWVGSEDDKPRKITFGEILDKTGIRVIPLEEIIK